MLYLLLLLIILVATVLLSLIKLDKNFDELMQVYADSHSNFYKWKGINVHFKDEGRGIPIIFFHGTSSSLHTWDKLTSTLKNHYRIIRMDLPGFGLTGPHPERDYSLSAYVQFVDAFTKHLDISHFILAGNSWGGMLAWYYSSQHQEKILGLILIDAAGYRMTKIPKRFIAVRYMFGRWVIRYTMSKWMVKIGLKEAYSVPHLIDNAVVTRYADLMLRTGNRLAFLDFAKGREWPDLKLLLLIHSPTLILWGKLDSMYNVEQAYRFKENLSRATIAIVENAGHVPMEEAPEVCARHICEFVDTQLPKFNL
jgi:pimeloyl-ACP methyl ester carboxylesterase